MQDGDAVGNTRFGATASLAFEDHDYGFDQSSRPRRSTNSLYELSGRTGSIPPPSVRA
ncbi:MAG: hypothetical protein ACLQRH_26730 [Acidimicrobiales bacterium]